MIYFGKKFSPVDECVLQNSHEVLWEMRLQKRHIRNGDATHRTQFYRKCGKIIRQAMYILLT